MKADAHHQRARHQARQAVHPTRQEDADTHQNDRQASDAHLGQQQSQQANAETQQTGHFADGLDQPHLIGPYAQLLDGKVIKERPPQLKTERKQQIAQHDDDESRTLPHRCLDQTRHRRDHRLWFPWFILQSSGD